MVNIVFVPKLNEEIVKMITEECIHAAQSALGGETIVFDNRNGILSIIRGLLTNILQTI